MDVGVDEQTVSSSCFDLPTEEISCMVDDSTVSSIHSDGSVECSESRSQYDQFYIGETMISAGTQTELSTLPCETLAYASDPVSLVQAAVGYFASYFNGIVTMR